MKNELSRCPPLRNTSTNQAGYKEAFMVCVMCKQKLAVFRLGNEPCSSKKNNNVNSGNLYYQEVRGHGL